VPQDRMRRFSTELFARYQRSEKALVGTLDGMDVQGVSTHKVKAVTEMLCGHSFSASSITAINKSARRELEGVCRATAQRELPLFDPRRALREGARGRVIVRQAVLVAVAVDEDASPLFGSVEQGRYVASDHLLSRKCERRTPCRSS
jgi:putative transposase